MLGGSLLAHASGYTLFVTSEEAVFAGRGLHSIYKASIGRLV
jgi:hypothetical protein